MKDVTLALILLSLSIAFTINAQDCGGKRWDVKTLSDFDTAYVDFKNVVSTTIHQQINLPKPAGENTFRMQSEDTVYSLTGYVVAYKKQEDDKDIHIVIQDPKTKETMVAEVICSECCSVKKTSRYQQFKEVDEWFTENIGTPKTAFTYPLRPKLVTLTGVGFFDKQHGQKGMALNGREIHPVLSIRLASDLSKK